MLTHGLAAIHARAGLRQPDHGLELADGDPPGVNLINQFDQELRTKGAS
jgi:hypothetical protein